MPMRNEEQMLKEEMMSLASEFGFLAEDVEQEIADRLSRAEKLDEVETVTFGLETDDDKIVKVFVNAKDTEKFEKIMADCLGSTDSIEEAINKAAQEVDIVDVEWPDDEEDDGEEEAPDGSEVMDPQVYGKDGEADENKKTKAKKTVAQQAVEEELTWGEKAAMGLYEEHGSVTGRMNTPNQQLVLQAILDLGIPEIALDRSPYRAAIIKGMRQVAQELQANGSAKMALKTFIKKNVDSVKHSKDHEPTHDKKHVKEDVEPAEDTKVVGANGIEDEVKTGADGLVMSESEDGIMMKLGTLTFDLNMEEIERVLKAIVEKATTVVGSYTVSPRGSSLMLKKRGAAERMELSPEDVGNFKDMADKLFNA